MKTFVLFALAGLGLVVLYIGYALFTPVEIGFLASLYCLATAPILAGIGGYIGLLVRDFTLPDVILTRGLEDTFNKRVFWMMGPQCIGAFLGFALMVLGHNALFGPSPAARTQELAKQVARAAAVRQSQQDEAAFAAIPPRVTTEPHAAAAPPEATGLTDQNATAEVDAATVRAVEGIASPSDANFQSVAMSEPATAPAVTVLPSFDCNAARSTIEHMICADPTLAELDARMAADYADALRAFNDDTVLIASQKYWLEGRDACSDADCVAREYRFRLGDIANHMKHPY